MTLIQALILGAIQGLTEFLPVSSSAHLVIVQYFYGLKGPILLIFDVVVHVGTLSAVVVYFRKDLLPIPKIGKRMMGWVVLATIPTAIIGFAIKDWIDLFFTSLKPVAIALVVNSIILWSTAWIRKDALAKTFNWLSAFVVGIVQGLSVIPGISRSGSTISTALWFKTHREEAFRFSFFLAIPAILGAMVIVLPESIHLLPEGAWPALVVGFISAFASGYFAISILFKMVLQGKLHFFAIYTLLLAVVSFFFSEVQS
jgi:undecaprenyl-diphosphatase